MEFQWDPEKEKKNIRKHGLDFETAAMVFRDPLRMVLYDELHSITEDRYITIGTIGKIIMVVYTERLASTRIISARLATKKEKEMYYAGQEKY